LGFHGTIAAKNAAGFDRKDRCLNIAALDGVMELYRF
jgi:hypothetical protein